MIGSPGINIKLIQYVDLEIALIQQHCRLRVGFDPTLRIADLQSLLQVLHGQIVAGPSALGIYTVALDAEGRPEAALDHALTVLRAHRQVLLAEPLQPSK